MRENLKVLKETFLGDVFNSLISNSILNPITISTRYHEQFLDAVRKKFRVEVHSENLGNLQKEVRENIREGARKTLWNEVFKILEMTL